MNKQFGGAIVDLGNIIVDHIAYGTEKKPIKDVDYSSIPEVEGCFDGLKRLNLLFGGNVSIIYNAKDFSDKQIIGWLTQHKLIERTGITIERVFRNRIRPGNSRDKTGFLDQSSETHFGVTVVVDDRLEVINHFIQKGVRHPFLFRPQPDEIEKFRCTGTLSKTHIVETWKELLESLKNI